MTIVRAGSGASPAGAALPIEVDRSSPVPLYHQVAVAIEAAIANGDIGPGTRLENEVELADRLGLSRPTMRRAIQELVGKGLLVRKRGVGTQVVQAQLHRSVELTSLYDDLARAARQPTTRILRHERMPADESVAKALGVHVDRDVVFLERVRLSGGEPLAVMHNWLPDEVARFSTEELADRGLYELLRAGGVHMRVATQRIGAKAATTGEARLLEVRKGAPLLTMERITYDDSGSACELGRHVYRAESYSFETTLVGR